MLTLSPSYKKRSTSDALLPEFANILVLSEGGKLSKPTGKPKGALLASHSLKTVVSSTESTLSEIIKLRDSVSLVDKEKDFS